MTKTHPRPEKLFGSLAVSFASILATTTCAAGAAESARNDDGEWSFARLGEYAERLAANPSIASSELPSSLRELDYDSYRLIAFRNEKAIWKAEDLPFWLEAYHRGYLYSDQVALNLVEGGRIRALPFDRELFGMTRQSTTGDRAYGSSLETAGGGAESNCWNYPPPMKVSTTSQPGGRPRKRSRQGSLLI